MMSMTDDQARDDVAADPAKTIAAQVGFAGRAGAHYLEAACRLMALASQVARDCWWPGPIATA